MQDVPGMVPDFIFLLWRGTNEWNESASQNKPYKRVWINLLR
jgi:hypothetical protein